MSRSSTLRSDVTNSNRKQLSPWSTSSLAPIAGQTTPSKCLSKAESLSQLDNLNVTSSTSSLHEACRIGNIDDVIDILKDIFNVNLRDQLSRTALHCAAASGHGNIVDLLLTKNNIDIEATDKAGMTPLAWAAWHGHVDIMKSLISRDANILATNTQGQSLLHHAASNNQIDVILFLCNSVKNFDINCTDKQQRTALHLASIKGHVHIVDQLLTFNLEAVNVVDKFGWTPVHLAARAGNEDVLKKLLLYGVEIDQRDNEGSTAILLAAANGHARLVSALLACNSDQNVCNSKRMTSLMSAAIGGHVTCARILIENQCNLNDTNQQGNTALHLAAINNHLKVVKLLLNAHCDVNIQNERSQTALLAAIDASADASIVETLLSCGSNLDVTEKGGRTALGLASRASMIGIVDLIITAERQLNNKKDDVIASSLECSLHYHHCFYQTSCSALTNGDSPKKKPIATIPTNDIIVLKRSNRHASAFMIDILWKLATKQLKPNEWKLLGKHWKFSESHMKAIEHQYTGTDSYRQHGYRLLLIWLHCLQKHDNPIKLLFEALVAIDRRELAEQIRTRCNFQVQKSTVADGYCNIS